MSQEQVDQIARAVLYEGYILYPYRPSSVKNRQRWTFGGIYPSAYSEAQNGSDAWSMQAQCLLAASSSSTIEITARFLHLVDRTVEKAGPDVDGTAHEFHRVDSLDVGARSFGPWQEAVERSVELGKITLADLLANPRRKPFSFPHHRTVEPLQDAGKIVGRLVREQKEISGAIEVSANQKSAGVFQITVRVVNESASDDRANADRDAALMRSLVSTHMILHTPQGGFVSPTDPPAEVQELAAGCNNVGCWPVLVGEQGQTDTLLVSPIILYDYPQIAPESPGDLFDGCEIDEILTLRIMTMTDDEKRQASAADPLAADMLARTESLARDQLMNLHGVLRGVPSMTSPKLENAHPAKAVDAIQPWDPLEERKQLEKVLSIGIELKRGDRVRLRPRKGGDIFDIALNGMAATIAAIEQDFENRIHLAVTIDDDPGRDLGMDGKPGHRFFFSPEEVEIIGQGEGNA